MWTYKFIHVFFCQAVEFVNFHFHKELEVYNFKLWAFGHDKSAIWRRDFSVIILIWLLCCTFALWELRFIELWSTREELQRSFIAFFVFRVDKTFYDPTGAFYKTVRFYRVRYLNWLIFFCVDTTINSSTMGNNNETNNVLLIIVIWMLKSVFSVIFSRQSSCVHSLSRKKSSSVHALKVVEPESVANFPPHTTSYFIAFAPKTRSCRGDNEDDEWCVDSSRQRWLIVSHSARWWERELSVRRFWEYTQFTRSTSSQQFSCFHARLANNAKSFLWVCIWSNTIGKIAFNSLPLYVCDLLLKPSTRQSISAMLYPRFERELVARTRK